jgi:hypothetical protein
MTIYQANDPTNPSFVKAQLERLPEDPTWVGAGVVRAISFINLYETQQIDKTTLHFNLSNIKKSKHEFSSYEENLRKNKLDDLLNPLIDNLKGA